MQIFQKTKQDEQQFQTFIDKVNKSIDTLSPYSDCADLSMLKKVKDNFILKTEDFYREDRKLNIGVIGQVKAGKSSFLNTLLFNGNKVLPSAATPKTATLTKIEYGETNQIQIEYYTGAEWDILESNAEVDSKENEFEAAREIMKMVKEKGIIPSDYIQRGTDTFVFDSAEELMDKLNDYVGENGTYTALVKNVVIQLHREELQDISVVDTPGLNDAIVSRTDRTRQFIELCDVVFFLSRASQFLDKNDMKLLTSQLPQKGVKKMIMVCSRFDDGLTDTIFDYASIRETIEKTKADLTSSANAIARTRGQLPEIEDVLEKCKEPVFVSSLCQNMSEKEEVMFDKQERIVYDNLNYHEDMDKTILKEIGNMDEVQALFDKVVEEKDETMSAKAAEFIPVAEKDWKNALLNIKKSAEKTLEILKSGDRNSLEKQKKAMSSQINGIKSDIENVFGEMLVKMEQVKIDTLQQLRDVSKECAQLTEKQGTEVHFSSYRVSDSKWYNPFSWGKSHVETSSYESTYTYLDAGDALENIRKFSAEACTDIEQSFNKTVNVQATKQKLLTVITENFDSSSELYDPTFFRLVTAQILENVVFPIIKMDVTQQQNEISSQFSGEVRNGNDRFQLQKLMSEMMGKMLEKVIDRFEVEITKFKTEIDKMKNSFANKLLQSIEADFDKLLQQFENKEMEIHTYEDFLSLLKSIA